MFIACVNAVVEEDGTEFDFNNQFERLEDAVNLKSFVERVLDMMKDAHTAFGSVIVELLVIENDNYIDSSEAWITADATYRAINVEV